VHDGSPLRSRESTVKWERQVSYLHTISGEPGASDRDLHRSRTNRQPPGSGSDERIVAVAEKWPLGRMKLIVDEKPRFRRVDLRGDG
jgi:hypothetical protein